MQVFHIPPGRLASQLIPGELRGHLVVSDVFLKQQEYQEFYLLRSGIQDEFIIVDSGAFEDQDTSAEDQLKAALILNADEVVLLDKFRDASRTVDKSRESWLALDGGGYTGQYMAVPQGQTFHEWLWCAHRLAEIDDTVTTFGV